jgi:hypothetical protein
MSAALWSKLVSLAVQNIALSLPFDTAGLVAEDISIAGCTKMQQIS